MSDVLHVTPPTPRRALVLLRSGLLRLSAHDAFRLFVATLALYLLTGGYSVQSIDTAAASEPAWVLATTGSLDLVDSPQFENPWFLETDEGRFSNRAPGAIAYSVPTYAIWNMLGGGSSWVPGVLSAAIAAALSVALVNVALAQLVGRRTAILASLFFGLGTATWAVSADAQWPHGINQLLIAASLVALSRDRQAKAGVALGLTVFARPQMAPAVLVAGVSQSAMTKSWSFLVRFGLGAGLGALLLIYYNWTVFGRASFDNGLVEFFGRDPAYLTRLPANVLGSLLDPQRGVLVLYPALVVLMPLAISRWRSSPDWVRSAALAGLAAVATQLALNRYSGGDTFFGSRLTIESLTLAFPLLVLAWDGTTGRLRRWTAGLLYVSVFYHAIGAVWYPHVVSGVVSATVALGFGASAVAGAFLIRRRATSALDDLPPQKAAATE